MQLIGYLDSPYVRRVAITARFLDVSYEHLELSIFRDFDAFREINPLVKVPTVVCDDGTVLVDSGLIIDYLESVSRHDSLMPAGDSDRLGALTVIGVALVLKEKAVQLIYELEHRPDVLQHSSWIDRLQTQLEGAANLLEARVGGGNHWLFGTDVTQADITAAVAWRFVQLTFPGRLPEEQYPGMTAFSSRAEALPEFRACPVS